LKSLSQKYPKILCHEPQTQKTIFEKFNMAPQFNISEVGGVAQPTHEEWG